MSGTVKMRSRPIATITLIDYIIFINFTYLFLPSLTDYEFDIKYYKIF